MAQSKTNRLALIRNLGRLSKRIDTDPRPTVEVVEEFFLFTDKERQIFLRAYNDGEDPISADIR